MGKCPKCENDKFEIEELEEVTYCNVVCSNCKTIVGVLEDFDFDRMKYDIEKLINDNCTKLYKEIEATQRLAKNNNNIINEIYRILNKR